MSEITKERMAAAVRASCASRGKHKGRLLSTCPSRWRAPGPDAEAAWLALMVDANPYKASVGRILMLNPEQRALFDATRTFLEDRRIDVRGLDRDRVALEAWGAW